MPINRRAHYREGEGDPGTRFKQFRGGQSTLIKNILFPLKVCPHVGLFGYILTKFKAFRNKKK